MNVQVRYVEYSGGRRVFAGIWGDKVVPCPEGCFDAGLTRKEAMQRMRKFRASEKAAGCSNFEYRVIPSDNEAVRARK